MIRVENNQQRGPDNCSVSRYLNNYTTAAKLCQEVCAWSSLSTGHQVAALLDNQTFTKQGNLYMSGTNENMRR